MSVKLNLFPNGHHLAFTMSFDDGRIYDRQLVDIFNRYHIKGTFHLNSNTLDKDNYITKKEVRDLYQGHEIALHTSNHYHLTMVSKPTALKEVLEDKEELEKLAGYPIRGMSLPFGDYNHEITNLLKACGVEYFRTVISTGKFRVPESLPEWHPTIHIKKPEPELIKNFVHNPFDELRLFYVWGHSYEFNDNQTWDMIEEFCKDISQYDHIWFATNIEIKDYLDALKMLVVSQDESMIYNPSGLDVYVSIDDVPTLIKARTLYKK